MKQYIDKDALVAEIERRIKSILELIHPNGYDKAALQLYKGLLSFTNTIEVKEVQEEPVSEELEEAAENYAATDEMLPNGKVMINFQAEKAFRAGAKWQFEQFEKNRLAACDRQAEEEAEIEQSFVMGIIENEHRQPTFDDAIKYGMRLHKEQMMAKAVETTFNVSLPSGLYDKLWIKCCKDGDKLLVIKKD